MRFLHVKFLEGWPHKVAAAVLAVGLPVAANLSLASPAGAAVYICNVGGNHYCTHSDGVSYHNVTLSNNGTQWYRYDTGTSYGTLREYRLELASNHSKCLGLTNSGALTGELRPCSDNYTLWGQVNNGDGSFNYVNKKLLVDTGNSWELSSDNINGHPVFAGLTRSGCSGCYQRWSN